MSRAVKLKIRQIELRTHAHATESVEKVKKSFENLISAEIQPNDFKIDHVTGSFGNPIRIISIGLKIQTSIKALIERIATVLPLTDKKILKEEFENRLDEKLRFYFRIEKQDAYQGRIHVANSSDVIQVIVAVQNKTPNIEISSDDVKTYFQLLNIIE